MSIVQSLITTYEVHKSQLIDWFPGVLPVHLLICFFAFSHQYFSIPSKQQAAFPHRLIGHWWKTNDACHNDFCQTSWSILAELGFQLTTPGLTARVKTDIKVKHNTLIIRACPCKFEFVNSHVQISLCICSPWSQSSQLIRRFKSLCKYFAKV